MNRRLVIIGFMGCGKSTVARTLSRQLGHEMIDLDLYITESAGRSPAEIIQTSGESAFRKIETRALAEALSNNSIRIIALGGGAWTVEANRALVSEHDCLSLWLDVPFAVCWQRITTKGTKARPLARDKTTARKLYDSRREVYRLANFRVDVDSTSAALQSINEIIAREDS